MPMSYPWYPGATNSIAGLDNVPQNGSLPHSPAALGGGTESPSASSHHGGFPSTSPYPALTATTSQQSSESQSQSPHGLPPPNSASFLASFGENSLQQHLYAASNRFGPFTSEGGSSSSDPQFSSPFSVSPQMLSQTYSMRSQGYPGMPGYGDSSQQDMARLSAYGASPYGPAGLDNYYSPFDGRSVPGAGQSAESMYSAADRMIKAEAFENGVPRASANPWAQFGSDGRDSLYLQAGYTPHPMAPYAGALGPMFHPNSRFHPMGYEGMPFKPDMASPYGLTSPAQQMMYGMDRKSPKKKDTMSPGPRPVPNPNDSPPVPNKASRYFSQRGIFVFQPPDTGPGMGPYSSMMLSMADRYIMCQKMLCQRLSDVDLPPKVSYVYNPLEYAFETHYKFVKKYYNSCKRVLFLGMNPGPFGMSQNGVPFGECNIVTDWMEIDGEVLKPVLEHPKRPVMGMECKRSEVSGARFWELFRRLCPTAESFFKNCAIHNLCPLAFMTDTGKNVAPSDMPVKVLRQLDSLCDQTFLDVVALFKVEHVITVGKYAYTCAQKAMTAHGVHGVQLHCMMHPSPANPSANKGWTDIAENQLREFGVYNVIAVNPQPPRQPDPPPPQPEPPQQQQQQQQQQQPQQQHHSPASNHQQPLPPPVVSSHHQGPPQQQQPQQQQQPPPPQHQQHQSQQSAAAAAAQQQAAAHAHMMSHHPHPHSHPSLNPQQSPHPHPHHPAGYPGGNPYAAAAHLHPHLSHHQPPSYHTPQPYPLGGMLQGAGGMHPMALGLMEGKRTCDMVSDGMPPQKHMRLEET